jgi:hypothetical protein
MTSRYNSKYPTTAPDEYCSEDKKKGKGIVPSITSYYLAIKYGVAA